MKKNTHSGFSLIELLIVIAIVAILTTVSTFFYGSYIKQSRRIDATSTLQSISLAEERYRTSNSTYGTLAQVWNGVATTSGGYYNLAITTSTATSYVITATAVGNQANDAESGTSCATLTLTVTNGSVTKTPSACWPP